MSSGDFNYVTLRNIVPFNADGSFVHTGYVLTVGPDAKQSWVNNLSLNALVVSTISVNSTVRFPAGIYDQLYVSSGTISTATIQTLAVTSTLPPFVHTLHLGPMEGYKPFRSKVSACLFVESKLGAKLPGDCPFSALGMSINAIDGA